MQLRSLTKSGLDRMRDWLNEAAVSESGDPPAELLGSVDLAKVAYEGAEVEARQFESRYEWAKYIDACLSDFPTRTLQTDAGLWGWLTLVYFDQVCPLKAGGKRQVKQRARYVPSFDFRTQYRHLLAGPWVVLRAHNDEPERVRALLSNPMDVPGELYEQIASRQDLVSFPTVVATASHLYFDSALGKLKRGAGGAGPGSPRRFAEVLAQLDLTYDVYGLDSNALVQLLPREFRKFLPAN